MLNSKSFLAVDFGAANLKLAEFDVNESGGLRLLQYSFRSLGQEGLQETSREGAILKNLPQLLTDRPFKSKTINVCAPGFHTFSKFVKLPPVDISKVTQMIQYEAQNNVPFPLEEVVWDYQILGAAPSGELEVFLVAIKTDIVEGLFRTAENAGLRLQVVDVAPAALCNSYRYNYPDAQGCTMLLDIGAKTSNLIFFENNTIYSRGINIGANAITQDFSREARLSYDEAERLKIEQGFVSLGGAYEDPDNPHQAAISKIARQVMTRLHIQVNQTIQFYRGQQGGSAPQRLLLAGGASLMPYTAEFFSEKLNLPPESIEYFNPLRNVELDPGLNREELAKVAHMLGEVVGLGLRNVAHCPIDLNLMPKSSLNRQQFKQKQPFLIAAAFCLILVVWAFGWFFDGVAAEKAKALETINQKLTPLQTSQRTLARYVADLKQSQEQVEQFSGMIEDRFLWAGLLSELRSGLLAVEAEREKDLKAKTGVWIGELKTVACASTNQQTAGAAPVSGPQRGRRGPGGQTAAADLCGIQIKCTGVSIKLPSANDDTAFAVVREFQSKTNYFKPQAVELVGSLNADELTFTFEMKAQFVRPIRF